MHALKSHVKITFLQVKENNSYLVLQGFFRVTRVFRVTRIAYYPFLLR